MICMMLSQRARKTKEMNGHDTNCTSNFPYFLDLFLDLNWSVLLMLELFLIPNLSTWCSCSQQLFSVLHCGSFLSYGLVYSILWTGTSILLVSCSLPPSRIPVLEMTIPKGLRHI